jgi:hypothetical protein
MKQIKQGGIRPSNVLKSFNFTIKNSLQKQPGGIDSLESITEPVFFNVYGAQKSIPRNEFHQPM